MNAQDAIKYLSKNNIDFVEEHQIINADLLTTKQVNTIIEGAFNSYYVKPLDENRITWAIVSDEEYLDYMINKETDNASVLPQYRYH